mmetsp:Transcript_58764/g.94983  ORF Transcript_58764/g.94983 Transcript_58764/m.94983 type:complete len:107 (+) Transcript_58764:1-321(+)
MDVQDGSIAEVSEMTCRMFKECMQGNFTTVQQVQNYAANCNVEIQKCHEEVQTLSEGTAGDAMNDDEDMQDAQDTTSSPAPSASQPGRQKKLRQIDADGWETVGRK